MANIELNENEVMIGKAQIARIAIVERLIHVAFWGGVSCFLFYVLPYGWVEILAFIPVALSAYLFVHDTLSEVLTSTIVCTNQRIWIKIGLFDVTETSIPLEKLDNVTTDYGLLGKFFHFGNIEVYSSSTVLDTHYLRYIDRPADFCYLISQQIQLAKEELAAQQAAALTAKTLQIVLAKKDTEEET